MVTGIPATIWQATDGNSDFSGTDSSFIVDTLGTFLVDPSAVFIIDTGVIQTINPATVWVEDDSI